MTKYVKLDDVLECAFDFFMTEESDRVAFRSIIECECEVINNAQAVEITEEQAIDKLHETGWLIEHDKEMTTRPQGEWIDRMADKGYVECPFCHKQITGGDLNFCVKCGADMRGGAE